jgi:hypothetical protein
MRQGQQHRRGRSRGGQSGNQYNNNNNNSRKGQNPISRTYQSNGPDGKVSGTASGVAEKYLSMARDALTAGDPVLAENYLQHAEHYNRIILAYRESQAQGSEDGAGGVKHRMGEAGDQGDDQGDDEGESYGRDMQPLPPMEMPVRPVQNETQPRAFDNNRPENRSENRSENRGDNPRFDERQPRFNDQQRRPQNNQPRDRFEGDRNGQRDRFNNGNERQNYGNRAERFQNDRNQGDRNQADRQPFGDRPQREPRFNDRQQGQGDRPFRDRDNGQPRLDNRPDRPETRPESRPEHRQDHRSENRPDARPEARSEFRAEPRPDLTHEPRHDSGRDPVKADAPFIPVTRVEAPLSGDQPDLPRLDVPRSEPVARAPRAPRRERAPAPAIIGEHEQPEFLRRPVRRPRREVAPADNVPPTIPAIEREPSDD